MGLVELVTSIASLIPKLLYLLTMSILSLIDVFQMLMRKLAGLDCYYVGGNMETGDIVTDFLTGILFGGYPILSSVFFGMLILGGILLFLSTFVAIIRNEYTTEKGDNTKGKIIGKAFKSVIFCAIVPIVTIFGMYLANVVLIAVDSATSYNTNYGATLDKTKLQAVNVLTQSLGNGTPQKTYITYNLFGITDENGLPYGTTNTTFSGTIFKAAAYGANRIRTTQNNPDENNFGYLIKNDQVTTFGGLFTDPSGNTESIAQKIDIAFGDNVVFAVDAQEALDLTSSSYIASNFAGGGNILGDPTGKTITFANKFDVQLVWYYYDLWSFNFVIALGAGIIMTTIFISVIFGLMRRIVEMIGLFIMLPPVVALMPLDNEKAYGAWRGKFLSKALMIYGAIGGMNVVMLILPELQKISFFNNEPLDLIVNTLLVLIAILAVKDFIGIVSSFAQGDDAAKTGEGIAKDAGSLAAKGMLAAASVGTAAVGAGALAGKAAWTGIRGAQKLGHGIGTKLMASGGRAGLTHDRATRKLQEELRGEHQEKATEQVLNAYTHNNVDSISADLQRNRAMAEMAVHNPEKYHAVLMAEVKKRFDKDLALGKNVAGGVGGPSMQDMINREFAAQQAATKVTRGDVWNSTAMAQSKRAVADSVKNIKDAAASASRVGWTNGGFGDFVGTAGSQTVGRFGGYVAKNTSRIAKPSVERFEIFSNQMQSILLSDAFSKEFLGDRNANLEDAYLRLFKHVTKKQMDKVKEKQGKISDVEQGVKRNKDAIVAAIIEALEKTNR